MTPRERHLRHDRPHAARDVLAELAGRVHTDRLGQADVVAETAPDRRPIALDGTLVVEHHHVVEQQAPSDRQPDAGQHGEQRGHHEAEPSDLRKGVGDVGPARHERQHACRHQRQDQYGAAVGPQQLHRCAAYARYRGGIAAPDAPPPTTLHWSNADVEVHRVVVGPYDNNVFVVRCRQTGDAVLIDAANEHERLLELCRGLGVRRVLETHGHWDHIQAVPALREAGYEVAVTALDAPTPEGGRLRRVPRRRRGDRGRPAPSRRHPHARPHAGVDLVPGARHAAAVHRRHAVPRRPRQHVVRGRRLRHDHRVDRRRACSRSRPTRSCCPATASTPPSAPSVRTSPSGSPAAGSSHSFAPFGHP